MCRIDTLLMDLGNVLVRVEPELVRESFLNLGVSLDADAERQFMLVCGKYEGGRIDSGSFLKQAGILTGLTGERGIAGLKQAWNSMFPADALIGYTTEACKRLGEAGVRIVFFSNTNQIHIDYLFEQYPLLAEICDDAVYSHITRGMKPDSPMYREAIEKLSIVPSRTLYFDDKPENIEAGLRHGFHSHVFDYRNPETFYSHLPEEWRRLLPV